MSILTTHTIELEDITHLELECKSCQTKTVRPLKGGAIVPVQCGNCSNSLVLGAQREAIVELVSLLQNLVEQKNELLCGLRFHLKEVGAQSANEAGDRGMMKVCA